MGYCKRIAERKYRIVYDRNPGSKDRRQKTETLNGVTKVQAEAALADRKRRVASGEYEAKPNPNPTDEDAKNPTMAMLFHRFMKAKRKRHEATTKDRYGSLFKTYVEPELGTVRIKALKKATLIEAYGAWEDRDGRTPSGRTLRHAHDLVRALLNWAVSTEILEVNVALKMSEDDLAKVKKPELRVLDEVELGTLLAEANSPTKRAKKRGTLSAQPWFYPAVATTAYTGVRRGETLALKWSNVNLEAGEITISGSLSEPRSGLAFKAPKNDQPRTVTISPSLVAILRSHRASQAKERLVLGSGYQNDDLVFAHADGSPIHPWNFGAAFKDLVARSGVTRITLHDLRDTHASLLAKAGVPLEVISRRLGHSSIAITVDRYMTVFKSRDAEAATAFEQLVG